MQIYSEELTSKVNRLKDSVLNLASKVAINEDARIECGILNRELSNNWNSIDTTIFAEEPSEPERQIDSAIEQAYQTLA